MRSHVVFLLIAFGVSVSSGLGQAGGGKPAAAAASPAKAGAAKAADADKAAAGDMARFRELGLVFERSETTYRMHADGTGERLSRAVVRIQSEAAARQFGVLSFAYASAYEQLTIEAVRVHKADGSTVETPATDAVEMTSQVSREAPLYSDLKEKHVPVRSLSAGDTLEYATRTSIDKAEAPGQFWGAAHFTAPGTMVVLAEVTTLEFPADKFVQVWSPNHKPVVTEHAGLKRYEWNVAQLVPPAKPKQQDDDDEPEAPKDPDEDADGRNLPSVAWTTFHTWGEVGDWYRGLALERAQPTDAIKAKAEDINRNAKTPEEQVRAIYQYVSERTRYVGIDFGAGRYQPHAAAEVMANQYGDCKDKDTLLEALLRAKGFATAPALIGAGITPVAELPSPAVFNHVITTVTLPEGKIWLDSTPGAAPYRYLSALLRDEQALVVPPSGAAVLEKTPAEPPYPLESRFEAVGELTAAGKLTSKMTASYRSDDEVFVRELAWGVAPADWDKASQYISSNTGFGGATSNTRFKNLEDLSQPMVVTYDYERHPFGDWDNNRIVPLFPALEFAPLASDKKAPQNDIQLGAPRTMEVKSRIQLPEGFHADFPDPVHVKTEFATFDKTYRVDGREIVAERRIVVLKKKVAKEDWKKYQAFTKGIGMEGESWITLIPPAKKLTIVVDKSGDAQADAKSSSQPTAGMPKIEKSPATAGEADTRSTAALMQEATQQMMHGDWDAMSETLDAVKAKNPNQELLWAMYGTLAYTRHNYDEAKANYRKELAAHPDNERVLIALADVSNKNGDKPAGRKVLKDFLSSHAGNVTVARYLASLQSQDEDYSGALKTLSAAAEQNPDDRGLRLEESNVLLKLDRKDEAAAAAKSVLDGSEDPNQMNSAAYVLAEAGLDLGHAEEVSRKSIAALEEKSASVTTAEVNSNAFATTNLLLASWDTLGWILFREDKPAEAKPWLLASWRNTLRAEGGDHLGQVYEAMGDKDHAAATYGLARAAIKSGAPPEVVKHIDSARERLGGWGWKYAPKNGSDALQDLRTYQMKRPAGVSGWGTFRVQIAADGVVGSQQMSGEGKLAGIAEEIKGLKFPELVPPESKAHLLKSAVVSCASGETCELVFVPDASLRTESY